MPIPMHDIERVITRVTLWLLIFFSAVALLANQVLVTHGTPAMATARTAAPLAIAVACLIAFVLARRGRPRVGAVLVLVVAFLGILNYVVVARIGLHSYVVSLFSILIIVSFLILGDRAGVGATLLAVTTSVVLFVLERGGGLVDPETVQGIPPINIVVLYVILFSATGAVLYVVSRSFHEAVRTANAQEQRFRQLIELAPLGFVMHREDRIILINRVAAAVVGAQIPRNLHGKDIYEFLPVAQRDLARARMAEALAAAPGTNVIAEYRLTDARGRERLFETITTPTQLGDGKGTALLTVMRDITTERETAVGLVLAKATAEYASRAKSQFLANMSHEIRTPMNAVIGLSELVLASELTAEQRHRVSRIHDAARALLRVINDVLDVSRIESGKMELIETRFDPRELLEEVGDLLRPLAEQKSLAMVLEGGPRVPAAVLGDEGRLRQILMNLVGNAIKFTERGEVRLALDATDAPPGAVRLRFRVSDTGVGIAGDEVARLFAPFTQVDTANTRRHGGTGLGLYIARQFAESMGGSLVARSTPGEGSTFELEVPLRTAPAAPIPSGAAQAARSPAVPLSVLLVEDNEMNKEVATAMLESAAHRVESVVNGEEAVRRCAESRFDCVLMDCQMPGMDGFEATRRIRAHEAKSGAAHVPIVALTASAMADDRAACLAAGMDDFLSKPFDTASLLDAVARAVPRPLPGTVSNDSPATFDPATFSELVRLDRETPGLLARIVGQFLETTPALIAAVAGASAATARDDQRAAHTLRSTAQRFGAHALARLAAQAEAAVRAGHLDTARGLAEAMRSEFARAAGKIREQASCSAS